MTDLIQTPSPGKRWHVASREDQPPARTRLGGRLAERFHLSASLADRLASLAGFDGEAV
jgi:hypothetical protein